MPQITREQRWLEWKNYDASPDPICPSFGCIEVFGYEAIGYRIVLQGRSSSCFARDYSDQQGATWNHAFNNSVSVNPGEIGQLTFDLPAWAAVDLHANAKQSGSVGEFGDVLTFGKLYNTHTTAIETIGSPWRLGWLQTSEFLTDDVHGYNVYTRFTPPNFPNSDRFTHCFVGGLRTFLRSANSAFG